MKRRILISMFTATVFSGVLLLLCLPAVEAAADSGEWGGTADEEIGEMDENEVDESDGSTAEEDGETAIQKSDDSEPDREPVVEHVASTEKAEAVVQEKADKAETPVVAGYSGGFFIRDAESKFQTRIRGRVQTRFTFRSIDSNEDDRDSRYAFSIPRARLALDGHAFSPNIKYAMQVEFGGGFTYLRDYYVDAGLLPGVLHLRVGQYKRPFSRQQISSSGSQELVDRAITDRAYGAGRDLGIMLHNDYTRSPTFEWAFGVFNGVGERPVFSATVTDEGVITRAGWSNVPNRFRPMLVARVGYNYGGIRGYSEADLEGGPLRFGIGVSGKTAFNQDEENNSFVSGQADYALKVHGFSTTGAVYFGTEQDEDSDSYSNQSYAGLGLHVQAGYLFLERYAFSLRYALVAPKGSENNSQEIMGGFSVYFRRHSLKWQTDGGVLIHQDPDGDRTDALVRTQLQLAF